VVFARDYQCAPQRTFDFRKIIRRKRRQFG